MTREMMKIPPRIHIETIFGCNAQCIMCAMNVPARRPKGVMTLSRFTKLVDLLEPYKDQIEKLDLYVQGEPLLDDTLVEKIRLVKVKGFRNVAISTNASVLNLEKQKELLESGIDTILINLPAVNQKAYESIMRGLAFSTVLNNIQSIISLRNRQDLATKFIVVVIKQENNIDEIEEISHFCKKMLSVEKKDMFMVYDKHSWAGQMPLAKSCIRNPVVDGVPCHMLNDRLTVLWDGTVPLCPADAHDVAHSMGNAFEQSPIEIFNGAILSKMRAIHESGNKMALERCKQCTILYSENSRTTS